MVIVVLTYFNSTYHWFLNDFIVIFLKYARLAAMAEAPSAHVSKRCHRLWLFLFLVPFLSDILHESRVV